MGFESFLPSTTNVDTFQESIYNNLGFSLKVTQINDRFQENEV